MAKKRNAAKERIQQKFLAGIAKGLKIFEAAKLAKMHRQRHSEWMQDEKYAQAFREAHEQAIEELEAEADRRAKKGSDLLLIFRLKALRPEMYRERYESKVSADVKVESTTIRVLEDKDWYGNANRLATPGDGASATDHLVAGAVQGAGVRPALGQNGNGHAGTH
jgi:uncharacterized protein YbjQ (UPF0145 family)